MIDSRQIDRDHEMWYRSEAWWLGKATRNAPYLITAIVLPVMIGCSAAEFDTATSKVEGLNTYDGTPVVCDPFDPSNVVSSSSGLKGKIHSWPIHKKSRPESSLDLIRYGFEVDANLFLNKVDVPTRMFDSGFTSSKGDALENENGEVLTEWFALDLASKLKLASDEAEGNYQLAILSDDGATLFLDSDSSVGSSNDLVPSTKLISSEGAHQTKLGCAGKSIPIGRDSRIPIRLTYFQGPRYHIALTLLWRKVDPSAGRTALNEIECGREGNEYYFQPGNQTTAAVPKAPYLGLLARGWRPLRAENFELTSGYNLCSK